MSQDTRKHKIYTSFTQICSPALLSSLNKNSYQIKKYQFDGNLQTPLPPPTPDHPTPKQP